MKTFLCVLLLLGMCFPSYSFQDVNTRTVSIKVNDAPLATVLKDICVQSRFQYIFEDKLSGFVTAELTEQSPENAIKLVLRSNTLATYRVENNVYIFYLRKVTPITNTTSPPLTLNVTEVKPSKTTEKIFLNYLDVLDLSSILGIDFIVSPFSRMNFLGSSNGKNTSRNNGNSPSIGRPG